MAKAKPVRDRFNYAELLKEIEESNPRAAMRTREIVPGRSGNVQLVTISAPLFTEILFGTRLYVERGFLGNSQ